MLALLAAGLGLAAAGAAPAARDSGLSAADDPRDALELRSIYTSEFGVARPSGIAYLPEENALVVAGVAGDGMQLLRLGVFEDRLGSSRVGQVSHRATLAFDPATDRLTAVSPDELVSVTASSLRAERPAVGRSNARTLNLRDPQGATFDPRDGTWFILDRGAEEIVRVRPHGASRQSISVRDLGTGTLQGLALNPADGLLYVMSPDEGLLYGVDESGDLQKTYSLGELALDDAQAIVFAPSADPTDEPETQHLYIADAGGSSTFGRVVEATLAEPVVAVAAPIVPATLVQLIHTSAYSPSSPDPAGVAYSGATDRLLISDSEVDEMTIYQGRNIFTGTRTGSGSGMGTTLAWTNVPICREPTGLGLNPADGTLYVSDDDRDAVYVDRPGLDGAYGTADDVVTMIGTAAFGSSDPEGVEFDPETGHLFVADGVGIEVYDIDPVDGVFGNGNDSVTHFDVAQYGSRDAEGIGLDPQRQTLLVVDPSTKKIYELTKSGALVRIIDISTIPTTNRLFAGVTTAPTSDPNDAASKMSYWIVDRQVDNNSDPNENDGKLYEISVESGDAVPAVTLTSPAEGATVNGTIAVQATASDDAGVTQVAFAVDGVSIGADTNGADGWAVSWNTTGVADGQHTVSATATDTAGQTASDSNAVTVDNVDGLPVVTVTAPAEGASIRGAVLVQATATDDNGVTQVAFAVDGVPVGTDTNGSDGWSASWDTATGPDGPHTVSATATDTGSQTATDSNAVTVDNTAPTVAVTAPAALSTVSGTISVEAAASDNQSVASVNFSVDGASAGLDTNGADGWSVQWDTMAVSDGVHELSAAAADGAGNSTTSATILVTVDNPDIAVLDIPVGVGIDDGHELPDGKIQRTGGDLELGTDKGTPTTVGIRFNGVTIPQGATVAAAYVQFKADERGKSATSLVVRAQFADNAASITTTLFDISSRPRTTASVEWSPPAWNTAGVAGPDQRTPDLSGVLQEVVNRAGWSPGNALFVIVTGTGRRTAESFEGRAPPVLHVEYVRP